MNAGALEETSLEVAQKHLAKMGVPGPFCLGDVQGLGFRARGLGKFCMSTGPETSDRTRKMLPLEPLLPSGPKALHY